VTCHNCKIEAKKSGKDRKGNQRYRCNQCKRRFQEEREALLGNMYLPEDKVLLCLTLLLEGNSIRSIERITGVTKQTLLNLLVLAGERCDEVMKRRIKGVAVRDVEADEIWAFCKMKKMTKLYKEVTDPKVGDAYTFVGIERNSKLILAWHLGDRDTANTEAFTEKLNRATSGHFQITTDGLPSYPDAISYSLGTRVDYAQLIKIYANNPEGESRYSPAQCTGCKKKVIHGRPDMDRVGTSRIERHNLSVRMENRRFTRLTNGFSKKWEKHHAALALYFAYYNFCRMHKSLRCTPAMAAGITKHVWTLKDLLLNATAMAA